MGKGRVLQASITGDLKKDFEAFQAQTGMNDSDAARDLLTLALRIKLNTSEDDRPSNRELLEEIYRRIRHVSTNVNITHTEVFSGANFNNNQAAASERRKNQLGTTDKKVDEFLEGKNKE